MAEALAEHATLPMARYKAVMGSNAGMQAFGVLWRALVLRGFRDVTPRPRCIFQHWLKPTRALLAAGRISRRGHSPPP